MAASTFTLEYQSSVAPEKMFEALVADAPNHLPKAMPQIIKSVEHEAGSIQKTTYADGSQFRAKIDSQDPRNLTCKYTVIHGELLRDNRESYSSEIKFEPSSNGGSIIRVKAECGTKAGSNAAVDHSEDKEHLKALFKATEDYLLANPAACA